VCCFDFPPPFEFSLDLRFTLSGGAASIWALARRGAVRCRTQFSQWWIWILELFFVSRTGSLPPSLFPIGEFSFSCRVYLLLPSTCFELQVTVLFLGSWILIGFWSFVLVSSFHRPDFIFL
jgi:hypothetical protein